MYLSEIDQTHINGILLVVLILLILPIIVKVLKIPVWSFKSSLHINTEMKVLSIECAINGIITTDIEGTILQWNGGAERMLGWKETEVLNKNISIIIPKRYVETNPATLANVIGRPIELNCVHKSGREIPITLKLNKQEKGASTIFVSVIRDITNDLKERKVALDAIALYRQGEDILECGTWSWNVTKDIVEGTAGFKKIFDEDEAAAPASFFLQKVWKGHRKQVDEAIKKAVTTRAGYTIKYGVVRNNGTVAIVECKAIVKHFIPSGEVAPSLFIVGTIQVLDTIDIHNVQAYDLINV